MTSLAKLLNLGLRRNQKHSNVKEKQNGTISFKKTEGVPVNAGSGFPGSNLQRGNGTKVAASLGSVVKDGSYGKAATEGKVSGTSKTSNKVWQNAKNENKVKPEKTDLNEVDLEKLKKWESSIKEDQTKKGLIKKMYKKLIKIETNLQPEFEGIINCQDSKGCLTVDMRSVLVDWLVEVTEEYNLQSQTIQLAVNYLDRYLSRVPVSSHSLQLSGMAVMLIAAKFEEVFPPSIEDFVYISDRTFTLQALVQEEAKIMDTLDWKLCVVTSSDFFDYFFNLSGVNCKRARSMADFFMELSLLDVRYMKTPPSVRAAAIVALACLTVGVSDFMKGFEWHGFGWNKIKKFILLINLSLEQSRHKNKAAVFEKYNCKSRHFVASARRICWKDINTTLNSRK